VQKIEEEHQDNESDLNAADEFMNSDQANQMNQVQLSQEQREQVITKSLTDGNPHAPTNITEFSHKDKQFKKDEMVDQLVIHFAMDGNIISKEGDEFTD